MKFKIIPTTIALAISLLLGLLFFYFHGNENKILLGLGSFLFSSITLGCLIGTEFELPRTSINIKVLSSVFFIFGMVVNLLFSYLQFVISSYIIAIGIMSLVFILLVYQIFKTQV